MKIVIILSLLSSLWANGQTQIGGDINGESIGDFAGSSVSMPDGNTVAIGAPRNDGSANWSGHVRVYSWNGGSWVQKGLDINGESQEDLSGSSVCMPDANTVAIGAPLNTAMGTETGHTRVYTWNGTSWEQKGADIDGEDFSNLSGSAVSMSDANTIAIGAYQNSENGTDAGHVRVYKWNGTAWTQKGLDIDGNAWDKLGRSVSMPDSNTIAIGAPSGNSLTGYTKIYSWDGTAWLQKGTTINGETSGDGSGDSVSMPDSNTIAIGATGNDAGGLNAGHVRIFEWNGTDWGQKGIDLDGENAMDAFGSSLSMPDANTIGVGAINNSGAGNSAGHVRVFKWDANSWVQTETDIDGQVDNAYFGISVSMGDANTISIGAPGNDWNPSLGKTRIFELNTTGVADNLLVNNITIAPNPASDIISIQYDLINSQELELELADSQGRIIKKFQLTESYQLNVKELPTGVYHLRFNHGKITGTRKIIVI